MSISRSGITTIAGRPARLLAGVGALLAALSLSACTTVEGTNAFADPATFEREVLRSTLQGVGIVESEQKQLDAVERGPLVVPTAGSAPPPPTQSVAAIPQDSARVMIDPAGLTDADLRVLQEGRVVGRNVATGRALTEAETRQLAARMAAYRRAQGGGERSIYLPPESYFTRVGSQELICQAASGELVSVNDPNCPPDVRASLASR